MNLNKIKLRKLLFTQDKKYTIKWINYEFCSSCNLRCKWCSLDHKKKPMFITNEILTSSLDNIIQDEGFDIERIDLHNAGETLLHPKLSELLGILASKKKEFKNKPTIHLLTNGTLLNEEKTKIILASNALDELRVSIDGGTRQYYNEIRIGADWDKVKERISNFITFNKKKIKIGVICMVPQEKPLTTDWMERDFKELFSKMDSVDLRHPHNWDGAKDLNLFKSSDWKEENKLCKFLLKNLVILPNGDVTVCCADLNSRGVVGNLRNKTLTEIFFSESRLKMIDLYNKGRKSEIELCKNCTGYYE